MLGYNSTKPHRPYHSSVLAVFLDGRCGNDKSVKLYELYDEYWLLCCLTKQRFDTYPILLTHQVWLVLVAVGVTKLI